VRRSRDVGGVGFRSRQKSVREVLEAVWKSSAWGRKDKGQKNRQGHPGSLELEAEGKQKYVG
jgi:hypothetical protein